MSLRLRPMLLGPALAAVFVAQPGATPAPPAATPAPASAAQAPAPAAPPPLTFPLPRAVAGEPKPKLYVAPRLGPDPEPVAADTRVIEVPPLNELPTVVRPVAGAASQLF
jgi:hypothetical protein